VKATTKIELVDDPRRRAGAQGDRLRHHKAMEGRLTDATVYTQLHQFIGTPATRKTRLENLHCLFIFWHG
jgi:hypothetical protein